ncbi:hypothetical protein [Deinococcus sedimenti]|nr:hypothetical protein [Deinococcus sedimenti]
MTRSARPLHAGPPVWDLTRPEGLGVTPDLGDARAHLPALRAALAGALVAADGADLVFVGRSPEPLRAYLLGLLSGVPTPQRVATLNVSLLNATLTPAQARTLRPLLAGAGLHPRTLVREDRRAALVDVVASGGTFAELHRTLRDWAAEDGLGRACMTRRVTAVGLLRAAYARPGAWRWTTQPDLHAVKTRSVLTDPSLWQWLAEESVKVSPRWPTQDWPHPREHLPERTNDTRAALAQNRALLLLGEDRTEREQMTAALIHAGGLDSAAVRTLIQHWRVGGRPVRRDRPAHRPRPN